MLLLMLLMMLLMQSKQQLFKHIPKQITPHYFAARFCSTMQ
jgi:hypothetical protein